MIFKAVGWKTYPTSADPLTGHAVAETDDVGLAYDPVSFGHS